jgi:hypothetical protein
MINPETVDEKPNKCCTEKDSINMEFLDGGDGVEWEVWFCVKCETKYEVPLELVRYFGDSMVKLKHQEWEDKR